LSRYEGFGLPPLEAMACGVPVICSNNSSLPKVVGDAALMFDADDAVGVSKAIADLERSPALRKSLSERGLARSKQFDWDRCADIVRESLLSGFESWQLQSASCGEPRATKDERVAQPNERVERWVAPKPRWLDGPQNDGVILQGGRRVKGIYKSGDESVPLVSYVTIVKNNVGNIERALHSVRAQIYPNVEHIVVDGASTDGTLEAIQRNSDSIDYFLSEPDAGLYDALNKAVQLARGNYICVLNSDDWLSPAAAATAVEALRGAGGAVVLCSAAHVELEGRIIRWEPATVHMGSYFMCANVCHNAVYASREAYEAAGLYDASYKIAGDFDWIMRLVDAAVVFRYTAAETVNYSLGGVSGNYIMHCMECMRVAHRRFGFLTRAEINGLFHSLFVFSSPQYQYEVDKPRDRLEFLRGLSSKYAGNDAFSSALQAAAEATLGHSLTDESASTVVQRTRPGRRYGEKLRVYGAVHLRRFPRVYSTVRRIYRFIVGANA